MLRQHEIRTLFNKGVGAVTETIRQLYEMIETDDERVQKLVRVAISAHLQKNEQLTGRIAKLEEELSKRMRQVHQLNRTIKEINKQLNEARRETRLAREAHLASVMKNSQNSSLPPSADRHKKTSSLREKSGKHVGGQVGHHGTTLGFVDKPDRFITHFPETCAFCGSSLSDSKLAGSERRQVHDLPPQKMKVTEHQAQTKVCGRCGTMSKGKFPAKVNAPVQYGEGVRAVAAYLMGYQLIPYDRCAEAMNDLFDCQISAGTLTTILKECASELVEPLMLIKEGLKESEVLGVDETNLRINQKQSWVHVSSTDKLTPLIYDRRRGSSAIEKIDILSG
jgi:transposase/uncharacterized coiled-coil protein SlyX